jgi:hypothetical protein
MSATKDYLHDYTEALDAAWVALEEAICKMKELNDLVYDGQEIRCRAPRADVWLLADKVKELSQEMNCYDAAKEPSRLPPILPGEVRLQSHAALA